MNPRAAQMLLELQANRQERMDRIRAQRRAQGATDPWAAMLPKLAGQVASTAIDKGADYLSDQYLQTDRDKAAIAESEARTNAMNTRADTSKARQAQAQHSANLAGIQQQAAVDVTNQQAQDNSALMRNDAADPMRAKKAVMLVDTEIDQGNYDKAQEFMAGMADMIPEDQQRRLGAKLKMALGKVQATEDRQTELDHLREKRKVMQETPISQPKQDDPQKEAEEDAKAYQRAQRNAASAAKTMGYVIDTSGMSPRQRMQLGNSGQGYDKNKLQPALENWLQTSGPWIGRAVKNPQTGEPLDTDAMLKAVKTGNPKAIEQARMLFHKFLGAE